MKHIKTYENKKIDKFELCYGIIKPENIKITLREFEKVELKYNIFEIIEANNNYNIITIANATKSQRMSLLKYITLVNGERIAEEILTIGKDITDMTEEEILERYNIYTNLKKYNL
jgi:hypothetical protein